MAESEDRVRALEARVQALEDELALHRLMISYGPAADSGDGVKASLVWTEDGVYDVDSLGELAGRDAISGMLLDSGHQALVPGCAHLNMPVIVQLDGDRATAIGYSQVWETVDGKHRVFRMAANHWEFARTEEGWRVVRRTNRRLGTDASLDVLRAAPPQ